MSTINPENPYNPAHAEDLTLTEVDQSVVSPLTGLEGVYPRYATFVYNVNNGNNNDIHPENPYNPAHAEDCALVEIDSSVIPPLSGKEGLYPRYAKLVYLLNGGGSGGTSDYNDLENKPTINGVTLSGDLSTVDLSVSYNDLTDLPTINGITLSGSKTSSDLGLESQITSTVQLSTLITSSQVGIQLSTLESKPAQLVFTPNISNTGAIYFTYNSNTYTGINPIYPDPTNNVYEVANASLVWVYGDNVGDKVDITISYRG